MTKLAGLVALLPLLSDCSVFFPEWTATRDAARAKEKDRFDNCIATLPILREEPSREYRVVQIVEAYSDKDLVWHACSVDVDAVVSSFAQDEVTTTTVGGGANFAVGRSRTRSETKIVGRAIKFGPDANQRYESPPATEK
jgi:hypothetical protein